MELIINIPEEVYNYITRLNSCNMAEEYIKNGTPLPKETVTEFADRCRECGAKYGEMLRDMEEIREVMGCDADAETKCRMISDILTAKPHYFKMPESTDTWSIKDVADALVRHGLIVEQESCGDAISRQAVLELAKEECETAIIPYKRFIKGVNALSSVNPQEPKTRRCKDCKWWKDSDGVYRRGVGAESKCPINNVSVNHGLGYCYMFEPQESEDKG